MNETQHHTTVRYSYAARASDVANISGPLATNMAWDGFWRQSYDRAAKLIQDQANDLLRRGNVTEAEARDLVEVQRNGLLLQVRDRLSPFGRFYSETLKPAAKLASFNSLLQRKGSVEAVLVSVGKTRAVTNRIAFIGRTAGPAGIVLEIVAIAVVVEQAPSDQRAEIATEEATGAAAGLAGGTYGYWGGGIAGAAWAGTWAAPTLVIPVVGEITEGGAVVIGGITGALFFGWLAHRAGKEAGHLLWSLLPIDWKAPGE